MVVARTRGSSWLSALPTGGQHTNFGGGLGEREAERNLPQPGGGSAAHEFSGQIPENRRIRELQSMVPEFVVRTRGSMWPSALPTGS